MRNCPTPVRPCRRQAHVAPPPSLNEAAELKEQIKQMQRNLATYERSQAKGKAKEEELEQQQMLDDMSEKEYED